MLLSMSWRKTPVAICHVTVFKHQEFCPKTTELQNDCISLKTKANRFL